VRDIDFDITKEDFFSAVALHALLAKGHANGYVGAVKDAANIGGLMASAQNKDDHTLLKQFSEVHDQKLRQDKEIVELKHNAAKAKVRDIFDKKTVSRNHRGIRREDLDEHMTRARMAEGFPDRDSMKAMLKKLRTALK